MLHLPQPGRLLLKRVAPLLAAVALIAIGAGSRAERTTAVDGPTITKAVTTGVTNPGAMSGYFTITIHIPTVDTPKTVHVVDAGASLEGTTPNPGACVVEPAGWVCRVEAADLVMRVSLPLSLASNAPNFCTAGTVRNLASMTDNSGNPIGTSNTVELTVPANPNETCGPATRQLQICKTVLDNGDGMTDSAIFGGSVTGSTTNTTWTTTTAVAEGDAIMCDTKTVGASESVTVTETTPGGWTNATGFPQFFLGTGECSGSQTALSTGAEAGTGSNKITICNRAAPTTRQVTVCKFVLNNGADPAGEGGAFGGKVVASGVEYTWSVTGAVEGGQTKCGDPVTIPIDAGFDVTETSFPAGWTSAYGYPIFRSGNSGCIFEQRADQVTAFDSSVDTVTVCNQKAVTPPTRTVTVCKAVLSNGDGVTDGGDFRGSLTPSTGTGGTWAVTAVDEGGSKCADAITIDASATFTVAETIVPADWTNEAGYAKYVTGDDTCTADANALSGKTFAATVTKVTVCNRRTQHTRTVTICKAVLENNDTIIDSGDFGGTLSPPAGVPGAWATTGVSEGGSKCADTLTVVANATFTLSEGSLPDGWTSVSGFPKYATGDGTCSDQSSALDAQVTFAGTVTKVTVCNKKTPATGTIRITKIDLTTGHATWSFGVNGPAVIADQSVAGGNTTGASKEVTGLVLNASVYTVTELGANLTTACPADNTNPNLVKVTQTSGVDGIALTTAGQVAEFTFVNEPCGLAGALVVTKVRDNNGNHIQDGLDATLTWTVKITGPAYPSGQLFTVNGTRVFAALIPGEYTIEETDGAPDYRTVGVVTSDVGFSASGTATTTLGSGDTDAITFYNQPRVAVRVTKTENRFGEKRPGAGWPFTLSGCGIAPRAATTNSRGIVTFDDLPPAVGCSYTVSEATTPGWRAFPGTTQEVGPREPGEVATVAFVNVWELPRGSDAPSPSFPSAPAPPASPSASSTVVGSTPISTATPTAGVPPSSTGTTSAGTPTVGASTAVASPVVVPRPPATGSGAGGAGGVSWLFVVVGMAVFAVCSGVAVRRRQRGAAGIMRR